MRYKPEQHSVVPDIPEFTQSEITLTLIHFDEELLSLQ